MVATWIDYLVVGIIIIVGLILFYRALKEPLDLLFGWLGRGIGAIRDGISGAREGGYYDEIRYGGSNKSIHA